MKSKLLPCAVAFSAILLSVTASAAQCDTPQGNAELQISGLGQVGSNLRVRILGEPYAPFILAWSTDSTSQNMAGGTVCLGPTPQGVLNGIGYAPGMPPPNAAFHLSPLGDYLTEIAIPDLSNLIGTEIFLQTVIADANSPTGGGFAISELESFIISGPEQVNTIFFDDFEAGIGNWYATNGLWQAGVPANGPSAAWGGNQCVGTDLGANYPSAGASTTLVSPAISLPSLNPGEEVRVRYREWFDTEDVRDSMQLKISVDGGLTWSALPSSRSQSGNSHAWTQCSVDLSNFAGNYIQLGFYFRSTDDYYTQVAGNGFFLDDVEVFKGVPFSPAVETFEDGIDHWWSGDNGLWQVGIPDPSCGPISTPSGTSCVGTLLDDRYPGAGVDTRLISASINLPAGQPQTLFFQHWFDTEVTRDKGSLQVSTDGGVTWVTEAGAFSGSGQQWTQVGVPLGAYMGQEILLGFYFTSSDDYYSSSNGCGWYIDDIRIQ